jgi:hypothetical protein
MQQQLAANRKNLAPNRKNAPTIGGVAARAGKDVS